MRFFGGMYTPRRFGRPAPRRRRLLTVILSVVALLAGLMVAYAVHAGRGPAPVSDPGNPVAVHAVKGRPVPIAPMRPYQRPPTSWPAVQTATVSVAGALVRAGTTPVWLGPPQSSPSHPAASAGPVSQVQVSVASQQAAATLGVHGMVFALAPAPGRLSANIQVSVDYSQFAHAYGGDSAGRLRLVELPACALTTPQAAACRQQVPVRAGAGNNTRAQRVSGDVTLPGTPAVASAPGGISLLAQTSSAGLVLAVTAAPSGNAGDFTAMPFSEASEWANDASSGTFSYSYPVQVPPAPGGFEPDVQLRYSSQMTDGLTSATNPEASWIGDGWDYAPGFIETDYPACTGSSATGGHGGDRCAFLASNSGATPALTLSLDGAQSPIVGSGSGLRAEADGGATFASGPNGSMVVTQRDGAKLYFGLNQLPGYASGDAATNSQWTIPLWNPSLFVTPGSWSTGTWRLMLDYEVDRHGNAIAYFYAPQSNWYAEAGGTTGTGQYVRGGTLSKIAYGFQDGHAYDQTPPGEVDFTTAGGRQDAPADLACAQGAACPVTSPTFWNDQQLTTIATKALVGTGQQPVDSWTLSQTFPATGDPLTAPSPWLSQITQTGRDASTPIALPPTQFSGTSMPNRVMTSADTTAGYSPVTRFRLTSITNPAGGVTTINYTPADPACAAGNFPAPASNATRCYPNAWLRPGTTSNPVQDWWNVYAVASKTVTDTTGGDPPVVTSYSDSGPGWHYDNDTVSRSATQTFDEWRGFRTITTEAGTAPDPVTETVDTYFQGMSRDCAASSCPMGTPLTLTSSRGTTAEDADQYAGMTFEEIVYNGAGTGNEVTDTIHNAKTIATTATGSGIWSGVTANITGDNSVATYTTLAGGGIRQSVTGYTYDTSGRVTEEIDEPDVSDSSQWTCTTKAYGVFDLVTEEDTYGYVTVQGAAMCPTATSASGPSVAQVRAGAAFATSSTYDSAGNRTQMQKGTGIIAAGTGTCPSAFPVPHVACWTWQTTQTATYDQYGRVMTSADADSRTTITAYTPPTGAEPTSVKVSDPMGLATTTAYDPARDLPLSVTDPAGYQTVKAYDALGRVTAAWTPGNSASGPAVATYGYAVSNTAPWVTTQQAEVPGGGYFTTQMIYDSLNQVREVQQPTASGGADVTDTSYNSDGWKSLTSDPYFVNGVPSGSLLPPRLAVSPRKPDTPMTVPAASSSRSRTRDGAETWETDTTYGGGYVTDVPPTGGTATTTSLTAGT